MKHILRLHKLEINLEVNEDDITHSEAHGGANMEDG